MATSVRAVDRALEVLMCFSTQTPALSLTQIAHRVEMHKSTIHRLLNTLEMNRFIRRDRASGLYTLGFRVVELASVALQNMDLSLILPYLEGLSEKCGETVDLAVLDGASVVYLLVVESSHRVKLAARVGQRLPVHCTATGKAFLAYLPQAEVDSILGSGMNRFTDSTLVSNEAITESLFKTRQRGFACSEQEYEAFINAVAAPILNPGGYPVAVIAAAGPSYRLTTRRMDEVGREIQKTIELILEELGAVPLFDTILKNAITGVGRNQ